MPEPTVTWFKDDKPIKEAGLSEHTLQAYLPHTYKLTIEHGKLCCTYLFKSQKIRFFFAAQITDAGKFMVRATNAGGEAISIADVIVQVVPVFEPSVFISPPPAQVCLLYPKCLHLTRYLLANKK